MTRMQSGPSGKALGAELTGRVVGPSNGDWDAARQAFNLALDQRPELVAFPADADDVARAVRFAAANGLRVAAQRTGHGAGPLGDLAGTMLLNAKALDAVELDPAARRVRVGAGVCWHDVVPLASEQGLAALHGSAADAGVVGYTLGGGVGWYARSHGLAANRVAAVELVTADGEHVRADADTEPDLFWALRGGGGCFGVVTALELELLPIEQVHAGVLFFPLERAAEVLHTWREWISSTPEEVTSVGRLLQFPPFPEVPEPLRGNSFAIVEAVSLLDDAATAELLAPLRALGPAMDTFATHAPAGIADLHMDPPGPVPALTQHQLLGELPAQAIDDLVAAAGPGTDSPLISVEIRQLGGALARRDPQAGALATIDAPFLEFAVGPAPAPPVAEAVAVHLARVTDALAPYDAGSRYLNFQDARVEPETFFDDATLARLRVVKARVDPANLIRGNHDIAPTS
ncbi:MAG TPA: FAD-binding protein [Conexibacter sp.]|jgi:FAD/FMN-containing dehydrogenase|nr:FAD-binding protein [Conexibacter sp.]